MNEERFKNLLYALCVGVPMLIALNSCALNCGEMAGKDTMWKSGKHMVSSLTNPNEMTPADLKAEKEDGGWYGCSVKIGK